MTTQLPTQQGGEVDDGGPAFPREDYQMARLNGQCGMSLRDYLAAKAMQEYFNHLSRNGLSVSRHYKEIADEAFAIADEMIIARRRS